MSFSIYGSRSEVNVSARENQVVINCEYREGGIGFINVTNLSLSGITMVKCGVQGINTRFRVKNPDMSYLFFALHVVEGFTVNLGFLFITNSTQIGLLCHTLLGSSHLQDSVITHSNYRLLGKYMQGKMKCSVDI